MERGSIGKLILVPAIITLGVTALRLIGELNRWSPRFFSREAGGAGALVGIVWLVFVFGVYFSIALRRLGRGPASRGRAIGHSLAALVAVIVLVGVATRLPVASAPARIVLFNVVAALGAYIAYRGWPEMGKTLLAYGLAARIPVAILMLVAMASNWGTHYELGPPGFPEMGLLPKWLLIGLLPQLGLWVAFTIIMGTLVGSLVLLFTRPPAGTAA